MGYKRTLSCFIYANPTPRTDYEAGDLMWFRNNLRVIPDDKYAIFILLTLNLPVTHIIVWHILKKYKPTVENVTTHWNIWTLVFDIIYSFLGLLSVSLRCLFSHREISSYFKPLPAQFSYLNFYLFEVVSLTVTRNFKWVNITHNYLLNLKEKNRKSSFLNKHFPITVIWSAFKTD